MYAVKDDSWRAISSEKDLLPGETAMDMPPVFVEVVKEVKEVPADALAEVVAEKDAGDLRLLVKNLIVVVADLSKKIEELGK